MQTNKRPLLLLLVAVLLVTMVPLTAFADKLDVPPVPPKSAISTTTTKPTEKEVNLFAMEPSDVSAVYKAQSGKFLVSPILDSQENYNLLINTINQLEGNPAVKEFTWDQDEAAKFTEGSFLLVLTSGRRVIITLNQTGRIQLGSAYYQIPEASYNQMLAIYKKDYQLPNFVQWLIYMIPNRVTAISTQTGSAATDYSQLEAGYLKSGVQLIRSIRVTEGEQYYPTRLDLVPGNGTTRVQLSFGEDNYYELYFTGNKLYVQSSDLRFGCEYTLTTGESQRILTALAKPSGSLTLAQPPAIAAPAA